MKKAMTILLTFIMVLQLIPIPAFATEERVPTFLILKPISIRSILLRTVLLRIFACPDRERKLPEAQTACVSLWIQAMRGTLRMTTGNSRNDICL